MAIESPPRASNDECITAWLILLRIKVFTSLGRGIKSLGGALIATSPLSSKMISISSCICALLLAGVVSAAPAASSASASSVSSAGPVLSSIISGSGAPISSAATRSTTVAHPGTSTASAPESSATVPFIDLTPNDPAWPIGTNDDPQPIVGSLGAVLLGPTNKEIAQQNPDLFAPPTTDHGSV